MPISARTKKSKTQALNSSAEGIDKASNNALDDSTHQLKQTA